MRAQETATARKQLDKRLNLSAKRRYSRVPRMDLRRSVNHDGTMAQLAKRLNVSHSPACLASKAEISGEH